MAAALPYVDDFLPANNLASLQALAEMLSSLDLNARPDRKQSLPAEMAPVSLVDAPRFTVRVERRAGNGS